MPELDIIRNDSLSDQYPLSRELHRFHAWADAKLAGKSNHYIPAIKPHQVLTPDAGRKRENERTLSLFKQTFSSFLWTGLECSNPESPGGGGRWDQLDLAGVYKPAERRRQIECLMDLNIENVRLGIPNHKIAEQKSWDVFTRILQDFKAKNSKVSVDLLHFGLPSVFRNDASPHESFFLNPQWPGYFTRFARSVFHRYHRDIEAITLVNEPLITNNFSSGLWNEAVPGDRLAPLYHHYFIKRALLIGEAAVQARFSIEEECQAHQKRIIFIHNDSCEYHAHDPDFDRFSRFLTSDLILGQEWLLGEDFQQTDIFQWMVQEYRGDIRDLIRAIELIRRYHLDFQDRFGKSMKADTVFGIDYYLACESFKHGFEYELPENFHHYEEGIRSGKRKGLLKICIEYWNHYQLPLLHTETNFVDYLSAEWGLTQLLELAQLQNYDIPLLGFTWYSLMDQYNWDTRLKGSPRELQVHPVGLISLPDYQKRRFAREVLPDLQAALRE